ncbi:hypothetical protein BKA64DRAFT_101725 [Cadophora sp. MPI-SDFR-AT-0126]|nr:hypothetical protein BKA64DRAFT_101725 [Leotiomycetes sp. MPI-SDFR-AT-0126]
MDRVANSKIRKRKAESQDNERLNKRLSLLNLERNGEKLYVPVEHPTPNTKKSKSPVQRPPPDDDTMQLDDTKHKVYIYDLDAELSDSESSDDGKLIFLPDIQKHLLETRIPPMILANNEGELAGNNQLVLYNIPTSLTVPEEQDSVRKAIIETRARARAAQEQRRNEEARKIELKKTPDARDWYRHMEESGTASQGPNFVLPGPEPMDGEPTVPMAQGPLDDDPDAMDLG